MGTSTEYDAVGTWSYEVPIPEPRTKQEIEKAIKEEKDNQKSFLESMKSTLKERKYLIDFESRLSCNRFIEHLKDKYIISLAKEGSYWYKWMRF